MKPLPKKTQDDLIKSASDDILEKIMKRTRSSLTTREALADRLALFAAELRSA